MPRKRIPWSKVVEEAGVSVRIYEREIGSLLYREVRLEGGGKDRRTLGHRDRTLAADQARALAKRVAEIRNAGVVGALTLGQLEALFAQHRYPLLASERADTMRRHTALLLAHFSRGFAVEDLSQHHVDAYAAARRSAKVKSPGHRLKDPGVRAGTVRNELHTLRAMLRWAQGHRVNGRRLLAVYPLAGLTLPQEKNARRPIATEERYRALLAVADAVESAGLFRLLLVMARETGRRVNAMCQLRTSDVLLTREQVERALGAAGLDLADAAHFSHGAIRWSEASDKLGFEAVAPISGELRAALDIYLRAHPRVGDVPLFEPSFSPGHPLKKQLAVAWMGRAVKRAKLPALDRGQWHTLRRLWASERRHLPAQDVAAAGGWRSLETMRRSYQQADAATIFSVVERPKKEPQERVSRPGGHTSDTPHSQAAASK